MAELHIALFILNHFKMCGTTFKEWPEMHDVVSLALRHSSLRSKARIVIFIYLLVSELRKHFEGITTSVSDSEMNRWEGEALFENGFFNGGNIEEVNVI